MDQWLQLLVTISIETSKCLCLLNGMCENVHGSFIHNSFKLELTQLSITPEWVNKLEYSNDGMQHCNENEWTFALCNNTDKSGRHNVVQNIGKNVHIVSPWIRSTKTDKTKPVIIKERITFPSGGRYWLGTRRFSGTLKMFLYWFW